MPSPNNFNLQRELDERDDVLDWKFGALSAPALVSIPLAERDQYLPTGETQFDSFADFTDCASRSPVNHLEAVFTYHYKHAMLPENKKWFEDNSYVQDGKITFSDRYIAILSGTTHQGNSLKSPIEAIRKQGLIPKKLLPKTDDLTWEMYYDSSKITPFLKTLGQDFRARFTIEYEQVAQVHFADVLKDDMLGVAAYAWPIPGADDVYPPADGSFNHAFLIYNLPQWRIFDNYLDPLSNAFTKKLSPSYKFYDYAYRVYIASEKKILDTAPSTYDQSVTLYQQLLALLIKLRDYLLASETIPPIIIKPSSDPDALLPWTFPSNCRHNVRALADLEGLTVDQKNLMSKVIHCESNYNPKAINYNKDPISGIVTSTDHGIAQWNDFFHGKEITPDEATNNPEMAVRLMCKYVKAGRISQWSCYKLGLYKTYSA